MPAQRPFAIVRTSDQWLRSTHERTSLDRRQGVVGLAWTVPPAVNDAAAAPRAPEGLAFDTECRLYHSVPDAGRVERILWAAANAAEGEAVSVLDGDPSPPPAKGDFAPSPQAAGTAAFEPRALAVDAGDRLFVADTSARCVFVYDLWSRRLLQRLNFRSRPLDLAAVGQRVWVLLDGEPRIVSVEARRDPVPMASLPPLGNPIRLALSPTGALVALEHPEAGNPRIVPLAEPATAFEIANATDIDFDGEGALVVARHPGEDFLRFALGRGEPDQEPPLTARGYEGTGIVRTPDGRVGFWSSRGFRHAIPARLRFARDGFITTFQLDSGAYQTTWGRLFLDACVPDGTEIRIRCVAADEPPDGPTIPHHLPSNIGTAAVVHPDLSPPLLPVDLDVGDIEQRLYRRSTGRELAWSRPTVADHFETYEAPIILPAELQPPDDAEVVGTSTPISCAVGRYLWVTLKLVGNTRRTPHVRCLRAEYPSHDYLRRLPQTYSRDSSAASFLRRYLAPLEGVLGELEARAVARLALVDPRSTPEELLPWLAGFLGLVLDERWPVGKRRELIEACARLFRLRGTLAGLRQFIEIFTDRPVHILEHFRLRGLGAPLVGGASGGDVPTRSVLGSGFRVGGAVGQASSTPLAGDSADSFRTRAHRFTVLVAGALSIDEQEAIEHILRLHRPAHTIAAMCTVDAGMRVGRGLLIGLSSIIGATGGFRTTQLGQSTLGRGTIIGWPMPGSRPTAGRVGLDTRVG